jgi:short-subunit dehydrogenase
MSKTILVLGATSAIAIAYCRRRAASGDAFVLVGRNEARLNTIASDLKARGARDIVTAVSDLADPSSCEQRLLGFCATSLNWPEQVLLAYGALGDQDKLEADADAARRTIDTNFTSAALWLLMAAKHLPRDRERLIVVLGSVAGDRGRRSNYIYGAAKAGLATLAEGLAHRLHGTSLHVLLVKPGFVDTPMTAHLDRSSLLWSKPDTVAAVIERAIRLKQTVAYAPRFWWPIMSTIRLLPRPVFFRSKL